MGSIKTLNGNFHGMCVYDFQGHFYGDEYKPKGLELSDKEQMEQTNSFWEFKTTFQEIPFTTEIFHLGGPN